MFVFHFYFQTDNRGMDDIYEGNNMTKKCMTNENLQEKWARTVGQGRNKLDNTITSSLQISQMRQQKYLNK
jgi:hypothetical protein